MRSAGAQLNWDECGRAARSTSYSHAIGSSPSVRCIVLGYTGEPCDGRYSGDVIIRSVLSYSYLITILSYLHLSQ